MKPRTIHGPGLFISQFVGAEPPFDTLSGLAEWAKQLGFKALQVPIADPRLKDLAGLSDKGAISKIESVMSKAGLVVSEIAAQRSGQLLAVHPVYDQTVDILASPDVRNRPAARQAQAERDLQCAIARAANLGAKKVVVFSGGLAWPYLYPYPPRPTGLIERAFDELARRWRPLLDEADRAAVDICFELHPGQDLHDGTTFERFLACVDRHPRAKINLRQVHLIPAELFEDLRRDGYTIAPGELGENITTRGIELETLPAGTLLNIGGKAVLELTGLRTPCILIDRFCPGLSVN